VADVPTLAGDNRVTNLVFCPWITADLLILRLGFLFLDQLAYRPSANPLLEKPPAKHRR